MIGGVTVQHIDMPSAPYDTAMHNGRAVFFAVAELLAAVLDARCWL